MFVDALPLTIQLSQTNTLPKTLESNKLFLLFNEKNVIFIGNEKTLRATDKITFDTLVEIIPTTDSDLRYLGRLLTNHAVEQGFSPINAEDLSVPENIQKQLIELIEIILFILNRMGSSLDKAEIKPKKTGKARHKWTKEVSEKEFYIDTRNSIATVMWRKRNEMLIKKGATMMPEAPLNKDGSVGFSAKMGDKIRHDHQKQFKDFITTDDIILKSVNEVGLFLYFAGTNSWLEMIDENGKTLNEWTVVK
ncbi:hypothetical protein [Vagococcus sp.]|uniref:hypothetical protein n=1 Tax=Vagococcus sp. TaxID=1933889 RepID=UPI003FCD9D21